MKKLAIVLAALLLACVFVGCGASTLLPNSSWKGDWGVAHDNAYEVWSFKDDNTVTYTVYTKDGEVTGSVVSATWALADDDVLTISGGNATGIWGVYRVEVSFKELKLYKYDVNKLDYSEEPTFVLEKYNDK